MSGVSIIPAETRRKIIEALSLEMSYRRLAESLGVTPASIYKYLRGSAVPRDTVVEKALRLSADLGIEEVGEMIINDIAGELEKLIEFLVSEGLLPPGTLSRLSDIIIRAKLALASLPR